jgi:linoleoyl-CoA desaturase
MTKIQFPARTAFHDAVKQRVEQYFVDHKLTKTGDWRMFVKTGVILTWVVISYALLVFFPTSLAGAVLLIFALAQGFALAGFNIAHDGAHDSYAQSKSINWLMGYTFDLLGGSQMLWRQKHNRLHHIYTNIYGADEDIDPPHGILRFSPHHPWYPWHRFQHCYAFVIYSFLTLTWVTVGDFHKFFSGHIGFYKLPKASRAEVGFFFFAKLFYFGYMLVLPCYFHPWTHVLLAFVGVHLILGLTLSVAFQLAHTSEHNGFPIPDARTGRMPHAWARHEVETTTNFAAHNPWVAWYLGGLNFQIEHHLFAHICHRHYPAISPIVAETCREFAIPYVSYPTVRVALAGHYRFLKTMGRRCHA